jgi:hypothetical protein
VSWYADGRRAVSYSVGIKDLKKMLAGIGVNESKLTEKSFKMLGVTRTLEAGMALEDVVHHGRWHMTNMPLYYKVNILQLKEAIASHVPV